MIPRRPCTRRRAELPERRVARGRRWCRRVAGPPSCSSPRPSKMSRGSRHEFPPSLRSSSTPPSSSRSTFSGDGPRRPSVGLILRTESPMAAGRAGLERMIPRTRTWWGSRGARAVMTEQIGDLLTMTIDVLMLVTLTTDDFATLRPMTFLCHMHACGLPPALVERGCRTFDRAVAEEPCLQTHGPGSLCPVSAAPDG